MSDPKASRPNLPGYGIVGENEGEGLLPWSWARERLERTRNYFLGTITPGEAGAPARPHAMVIRGFGSTTPSSSAPTARRGRGRTSPRTRAAPSAPRAARKPSSSRGLTGDLTDPAAHARFVAEYKKKYDYDVSTMTQPIYVVKPRLVFGQVEKTFTKSATRWKFEA